MVFIILLLFILLVLPLMFFLVAAIAESVRSTQKGAAFLFRIGEIAVGIIIFCRPLTILGRRTHFLPPPELDNGVPLAFARRSLASNQI
jgi:hypothetical protein